MNTVRKTRPHLKSYKIPCRLPIKRKKKNQEMLQNGTYKILKSLITNTLTFNEKIDLGMGSSGLI